ncbi:MAG: ATP-binding protein [Myxococcota bacterium]|nr:ATP-binding protein [Myxococcota bacterium]
MDWRVQLSASLARELDVEGLARSLCAAVATRIEAPVTARVGDTVHTAPAGAPEAAVAAEVPGDGARFALEPERVVVALEARGRLILQLGAERTDREALAAEVAELGPLVAALVDGVEMYQALDLVVQQEMAAAIRREEHIKLLMDSMHDGLIVCGLDGLLTGTRSAAAQRLLGDREGEALWDVLGAGEMGRLAYEQLAEDLLPFEVSAAAMPAEIVRDGRVLRLGYRPVIEDGRFAYVLLIVRDATAEVAAERADAERRQMTKIVSHLVADHGGFLAFVREVDELLRRLGEAAPDEELLRALHTLKGNTAIFGFDAIAARCHALEERLAQGAALTREDVDGLALAWRETLGGIGAMLEGDTGGDMRVLRGEYDRLCAALEREDTPTSLRELVASWEREAVRDLLTTPGRQAERLAAQLGKHVDVVVAHNDVRLPHEGARGLFRSLVHLIRNALDHGLEGPAERVRAGKPERGALHIAAHRDAERFTISVRDDGRGIDEEAVRRRARERGLDSASLLDALCADGVSTRDAVSEVSGRGVGLAAVRGACEALGGQLELDSRRGEGTTFRCVIPA